MDDRPSKLWNLALLLSLLLLAGVSYYRFAPVREIVDAKCPWIKEQLAKQGIQFGQAAEAETESTPDQPVADDRRAQPTTGTSTQPAAETRDQPLNDTPDQPRAAAPAQPMSLAQIAANRSLWPKTVKNKKATEFPAVNNGKEVGTVNLPAGMEVQLISVTSEKVGVAFSVDGKLPNAGGVWLQPADTDLMERIRHAR